MIIVVLTLWILIWLGIRGLTTLDANKYYSESCVNLLYGPLNEWVYYAAMSKQLSGDITPDMYLIQKEAMKFWVYFKVWERLKGRNLSYRVSFSASVLC